MGTHAGRPQHTEVQEPCYRSLRVGVSPRAVDAGDEEPAPPRARHHGLTRTKTRDASVSTDGRTDRDEVMQPPGHSPP